MYRRIVAAATCALWALTGTQTAAPRIHQSPLVGIASTIGDAPAPGVEPRLSGNVSAPSTAGLVFQPDPVPERRDGFQPSAGATPASFAGLNPVQPQRVLDTRSGIGAPGPVGAGETRSVHILGVAGVPADAASVVLNVTVTEPSVGGYVTVWPSGTTRPNASSLNMAALQTVANLVIAKIGADGAVSLYNDTGTVQLLADVVGWSRADGHYVGLTPARVLDTRNGLGGAGPVGAGQVLTLTVAGTGGVPATGVGAVALNVTVTEPTAPSFVTVWPSGSQRPNASSLNMAPGQTVPNLVLAPVGADGKVSLYNDRGTTQLVADVVGWLPAGAAYLPVVPTRVMDTRTGSGNYGVPTTVAELAPLAKPNGSLIPHSAVDLDLRALYPAYGTVSAYVLNVTVTGATATSYATVWPAGSPQPNASNLNVVAGSTVPNLVLVKAGRGGRVTIYNDNGFAHVLVDLVGVVPLQNALDTPDDSGGSKFHVVLVQGSDSVENPAMVDMVRNDVNALDGWFAIETGRHLNIDRSKGSVEVTTFRVASLTEAQLAAWPADPTYAMIHALSDAGFASPYGRRWLFYIDTASLPQAPNGYCGATLGQFSFNFTTSPCSVLTGTVNAADVGSSVNSAQVSLHEMLHALGATPACAPDIDTHEPGYSPYSTIGHSSDVHDLMYWNAGNQPKHIDPTHRNYFGHTNTGCTDLALSSFVAPATP